MEGPGTVRFAARRCESIENLLTCSLRVRIALVDCVGTDSRDANIQTSHALQELVSNHYSSLAT